MATAKKTTTKKKSTTSKKTKSEIVEFDLLEGVFKDELPEQEPELTKEDFKIKKLGPFDILNMMFDDTNGFNTLTDKTLQDNYFLLNRRFAIKYPMQAAQLSKMGINEAWALRFWAMFIKAKENCAYGAPKFLYTAGAKKQKESKEKVGIDAFDEEIINQYMIRYELSKKDFQDMLEFSNEQTVSDVERFYKAVDPTEQKKLFVQSKGTKKSYENDD